MVVDMKAKNKGRPQSFGGGGGTPNKNRGNFQGKKSFSPGSKGPQGGGGGSPNKNRGNFQQKKSFSPQGGEKATKQQFGNKNSSSGKVAEGKPDNQQQKQGISAKLSKQGPKAEQNGRTNKGDSLKQLNDKSKPDFKASKGKQGRNEGRKRNKSTNRYHRFQEKISKKVRTPQSCARALKAEQELTASNNRILRIILPDPVITPETVQGWTSNVESVLFTKTLEPRHFTIVLNATANVKKEIEKLSKITVGSGKLTVKENDPAELGHTGGTNKEPAQLIDPYTLYVTNLPEGLSRMDLEKIFPDALISSPKKHNPKMGTPSKFAFVSFDTPEAALTALKENFNKEILGKSIVMRFRRLSIFDLKKEEKDQKNKGDGKVAAKKEPNEAKKQQEVAKAGKAATEVKKQDANAKSKVVQGLKGNKAVKQEPVDEDDDDDDEEEESDKMGLEDDDDESDDDEDMEMEEDDDDDDDEEDDDDDDGDDDDDDDDDE